ncbi:Uncharacterized protein Adt_05099 [Abeliophyllum distichum]|uniref:DUF4283 domain-containing protein n=1 Tax=Abeliophyllum distichum TaxID=126358 RepID=A0ABD1V363_9LAMI
MGCSMRILKWTCYFHPDAETPIAPVWISFPLLLVHLHAKEFLFALSKIVGVPLRIDEATADLLRPSEARVCVEVNLEHKLPDRIWIDRGASRSFWQPIVYERLSHFCTKCRHMGHIIDHCRVEAPPVDTVVTQASKPFITPDPKPAVASASKPVVVLATKEVDTPVPIADRAGKVQPVFDIDSHVSPCLSSNENVEVSIFSDTANSIQLEVHLPGIFCRNSSDDLVGLDERQEADGFTNGRIRYGVFWNLGTTVTSIVDHPQFFHNKVEDPRLVRPVFITLVYASCSSIGRRDLRARLHQIAISVDGLWLVGRDFNVIAHNGERTATNGLWFDRCRVFWNSGTTYRIRSITSASGEVFESSETIQPSAISFFQELLSAPPQPVDHIRHVIIPRLVSDKDNL